MLGAHLHPLVGSHLMHVAVVLASYPGSFSVEEPGYEATVVLHSLYIIQTQICSVVNPPKDYQVRRRGEMFFSSHMTWKRGMGDESLGMRLGG